MPIGWSPPSTPPWPPPPDDRRRLGFAAIQTLRGWASNALDGAFLPLAEPVTLVFLAALAAVAVRQHRRQSWPATRWIAYLGFGAWLLATLGITIYPLTGIDLNVGERWETQSIIPLAGTIESFGNMRDRTMSAAEVRALEQKIAADLEIPVDEVNLDPRIQGISLSTALRDPVGNLLLFVPLGFLAPGALGIRDWRRVAALAAAIGGAIELSQLLLSLGSLASIDDVIFNTAGALLGLVAWLAVVTVWKHGASRIAAA